jgi:hypothetical protein
MAELTATRLVNQHPNKFIFLQACLQGTTQCKAGDMFEAMNNERYQRMTALMVSSPGLICPAGLFDLVRMRQMGDISIMTMMIENYRADVLGRGDHAPAMIRAMGCGMCGASEPEGEPFSFCSRCKFIVYCSKECQKEHWRTHKRTCLTRT